MIDTGDGPGELRRAVPTAIDFGAPPSIATGRGTGAITGGLANMPFRIVAARRTTMLTNASTAANAPDFLP